MMNPEIKARWLTKLRDPEARQTREDLKNDEGQCCLGLLCDIAVEDGIIDPPVAWSRGNVTVYAYAGSMQVPPAGIIDWAGLFGTYHFGDSKSDANQLIDMNDGTLGRRNKDRLTFPQIADMIERFL